MSNMRSKSLRVKKGQIHFGNHGLDDRARKFDRDRRIQESDVICKVVQIRIIIRKCPEMAVFSPKAYAGRCSSGGICFDCQHTTDRN